MQGENQRDQWPEKSEQKHKQHFGFFFASTYDISSIKRVTRKFHVVIVQQQRERNLQKKSVLHLVFLPSRCRRLALYENINCLSKL